MANAIIDLLMKDESIPMSWGVNEIKYLADGVTFKVNGFKFKGYVMVLSANKQCTKFNIMYIKDNEVIDSECGVKARNLVSTIDKYVELVDNYGKTVNDDAISKISKMVGFDVSGFKNIMIV